MDLKNLAGPPDARQGGLEMTATDVPGSTPDPIPSQKDLRGNSTKPNPGPAEGATPEFALELDLGLTNDYFASKLERDILRDIENYDINKIPPSMEHAQLHAECCKFGQPIQNLEMEKVKFCPCCCNIETLPFDAFVKTSTASDRSSLSSSSSPSS